MQTLEWEKQYYYDNAYAVMRYFWTSEARGKRISIIWDNSRAQWKLMEESRTLAYFNSEKEARKRATVLL